MELWQLVARESVRDLIARYNANGDVGRFAEVLALFHPDAVMELPDARYEGIEQIASIFSDTKANFADFGAGTGAKFYMRHNTSSHMIDIVDEGRATSRCYYLVVMAHGVDHWGRYIDEYGVHTGRWVFTSRRVTMDGFTPGGFGAAANERYNA